MLTEQGLIRRSGRKRLGHASHSKYDSYRIFKDSSICRVCSIMKQTLWNSIINYL